jgi:hypothetical protein
MVRNTRTTAYSGTPPRKTQTADAQSMSPSMHNVAFTIVILIVFLTGVVMGVKISGATHGTDGLLIMVFALGFLNIVMSFLIFTQLMHLRAARRNVK